MLLRELLASEWALPSIPRVVALLLSELERGQPELKKVSQLISIDPALTVNLLQRANSTALSLSGQLRSVPEALAVVGLHDVREMAQAAAARVSLKAVPGIRLQLYWDYCLDVAKVSRSLASVVRQNQQAAFTAGLIHFVGELAMRMAAPKDMAALDAQVPAMDPRRARAERRQFDLDYAQVGAALARQWLLPEVIIDAIEHQDAPFLNQAYEPLAGVIHLACWRARAKMAGMNQREMAVSFPGAVGEVLSLDIDMVLQQDPIDWTSQHAG
jgi:HD-like signal output (HDOD) protein